MDQRLRDIIHFRFSFLQITRMCEKKKYFYKLTLPPASTRRVGLVLQQKTILQPRIPCWSPQFCVMIAISQIEKIYQKSTSSTQWSTTPYEHACVAPPSRATKHKDLHRTRTGRVNTFLLSGKSHVWRIKTSYMENGFQIIETVYPTPFGTWYVAIYHFPNFATKLQANQ